MRKKLYLAICILLSAIPGFAQQTDPNNGLKHWMTPEEALQRDLIGRGFVETDPPTGIIRNVEEFGPAEGVLIRYPFGIPLNLIKEMAESDTVTTIVSSSSQQATVTSQYQANGMNLNHCKFLIAPTNTYWTRDYGPWYVTYGDKEVGIVDFPYNRPRPNDDEIPKKVATSLGIEWFGMNVIHTGGNYMTDGTGQASSTTLVWDENPSQTHEQIAQKVHDYLGIDNYMVVADPNGTYIDHIDCWGKFLAPDKVLIRKVPFSHPQYSLIESTAAYYATQNSSYGTPYRVYRVNTPNDEPYTNSYILNRKVFVPIMGNSNDAAAIQAYQAAMPGYEVLGFLGNPSTPWESTDALHCRTHEMADRGMLYIEHLPLTGVKPAQFEFDIDAEITAFSNQPVYTDSTWVIYKVNSAGWDTLALTHISGNHWHTALPGQMEGDTVSYFITAADASGRRQNHPYIGAPDPHVFIIKISNPPDVVCAPDTLKFTTWEDMFYGKSFITRNFSTQPVVISHIDQEDLIPFSWNIDPWNISLPYTINSGDSLALNVRINIPASRSDVQCDSLRVVTSESLVHNIQLCLDLDLFTGTSQLPESQSGLKVFPNPVNGEATIQLPASLIGNSHIEVFSSDGTLMQTLNVNSKNSHQMNWTTASLPEGIYLLKLNDRNHVSTTKVLINR
ncbi:MAG TPA: agmatine deiminase family protein [Bacteroidales bacterium]|nr:agmatine deiminase family protein [Bacteroidales bacterium]